MHCLRRPLLRTPTRLAVAGALLAGLSACYKVPPAPLFEDYPLPVQTVREPPRVIQLEDGSTASTRASYRITAHVMATKNYDDEMTDAVPMDFALAWGAAATPEAQAAIEVRQSGRWYYWRVPDPERTTRAQAAAWGYAMANVHIVPANEAVLEQLEQVRAGDTVALEGHLVDMSPAAGGSLKTSLSRTDAGAGSCEILLVEVAEVFVR